MTNTYADATGVLTFDGPAIVSPVITALFKPFRIGKWPIHSPSQLYIAQATDETANDWESYLDEIATTISEQFVITTAADMEAEELFAAIGAHFGVDLSEWMDSVDFDLSIEMADIVDLANQLKDGHNLIGFSLEGAIHADRLAPGEFGGSMSYQGEHYRLTLGTSELLRFADAMNAELATVGPSLHTHLQHWLEMFFYGIHDRALRSALKQQFGMTDVVIDEPQSDEDAWSRLVYVRAFGVHGEIEPRCARLLITPQFIENVARLRRHCQLLSLTELRVTGSPDAWGSGFESIDEDNALSELIITPNAFWYHWESSRHNSIVESEAQSIDWLLSTVTGSGDPILMSLTAEQVAMEFPASA